MTADMGAAVKDALALDLSMTYEELQHTSAFPIHSSVHSKSRSTYLIDPPNWPTATESAHSPDWWSVNNNDRAAVSNHSDQTMVLHPSASASATNDESHAVMAADFSTSLLPDRSVAAAAAAAVGGSVAGSNKRLDSARRLHRPIGPIAADLRSRLDGRLLRARMARWCCWCWCCLCLLGEVGHLLCHGGRSDFASCVGVGLGESPGWQLVNNVQVFQV
jgi:hypothetical protein